MDFENHMKILLISVYNYKKTENVGLNRIKAFFDQKKIDCKILYVKVGSLINNDLLAELKNSKFIGMSIYPNSVKYAGLLATRIKNINKKAIIFFGSQYATNNYKKILEATKSIDFIVLGLGELPLFDFVSNYNGYNIELLILKSENLVSHKHITNKGPFVCDISDLPWPNPNREFVLKNFFTYLPTSHGCVGKCSFCGRKGGKWTGREPEDILSELKRLKNEYNISAFFLTDSSFEDPGHKGKERINKIADCILDSNEKFAFHTYFRAESFKNNLSDIKLLTKLSKAGFNQCLIGIDAGNENDLLLYKKRATLKNNDETLILFKKCRIEPFFGFIMLNPYSTKYSLQTNFYFLQKVKSYFPAHYINYLIVYENTDFYKKIKIDNLIINNEEIGLVDYQVLDPFAQKIKKFIDTIYTKSSINVTVMDIQYSFQMIYFMLALLINTEKQESEVEDIKKSMFEYQQEFFSPVYISENIPYLYNNFDSFTKNILNFKEKLKKIYMSLLKRYITINYS